MDISPAQMQVNAARQRQARLDRIAVLRDQLRELEVRLYNAEQRPADPIKSAQVEPLRHRVELARGELDAAIARDAHLTNGVNPASPAKIAADAAFVKAREVKANRAKAAAK